MSIVVEAAAVAICASFGFTLTKTVRKILLQYHRSREQSKQYRVSAVVRQIDVLLGVGQFRNFLSYVDVRSRCWGKAPIMKLFYPPK